MLVNKQFMPKNVPSIDDFDDSFVRRARTLDVPITDIMPLEDLYKVTQIMTGLELGTYNREELKERIDRGLNPQNYPTIINIDPTKEEYEQQSAVNIPITQPQATAAAPQVAPPVATGTAQGVTPTETALLSPTELAIRKRRIGTV